MRTAKQVELEPPRPGELIWTALEDRATILRALRGLAAKLRDGAKILSGMGGEIIWVRSQAFWAQINGIEDQNYNQGRYWNPFGLVPDKFRQNMIVEINPPASGKNTNVQGLVARDTDDATWILHAGRLTIPGHRVTGEEFDKIFHKDRVVAQFRDGSTFRYHPIVMIDDPAEHIQAEMGAFIRSCKYIRDYYSRGEKFANELQKIEQGELRFVPELEGDYAVAPRGSREAKRRHATIVRALAATLKELGVDYANERLGRYGPDLFVIQDKATIATLFEIKSVLSASAVYEGFGQLHIYERLIGKEQQKVLVLPNAPSDPISEVLKAYDVSVLPFRQDGERVTFDHRAVRRLIDSQRPQTRR